MTTTIKQPKQNNGKTPGTKPQVLESLRDLTGDALDSLGKDVALGTPQEFLRQMLGLPEKRVTGDLVPGETLEMNEAMSGKLAEKRRLEGQLRQERSLRQEEQLRSAKKQQELKLQLTALTSEVTKLAQTTSGLSHEVQIAAMQAPVEPGTYHVIFFEKLLEFIHSFRKKIDNASVWLSAYNTRAKRRAHTFWAQVGISGAKRMLSPEDYLQRSAA